MEKSVKIQCEFANNFPLGKFHNDQLHQLGTNILQVNLIQKADGYSFVVSIVDGLSIIDETFQEYLLGSIVDGIKYYNLQVLQKRIESKCAEAVVAKDQK